MILQQYQDIADYMTGKPGEIRIMWQEDHADITVGKIFVKIPTRIISEEIEYQWYYVIHEVCHILTDIALHNKTFKAVEKRWLAEFNLRIIYKPLPWDAFGQPFLPAMLKTTTGERLFPPPPIPSNSLWWILSQYSGTGNGKTS